MKRGRPIKYNKIPGIYMIQSILKPDRIYIGSAGNIYKRWYYHSLRLKSNIHENKKLQNHYNKYGKSDLQFSVLLGCSKEDMLNAEQFFLDSYDPYFNICKYAYSSLGRPPWNKGLHTGIIPPSVYKKGNIPHNKGKKMPGWTWMRGRKLSDEHKLKLANKHKGMKYKKKHIA